jgi:hypothetical protein
MVSELQLSLTEESLTVALATQAPATALTVTSVAVAVGIKASVTVTTVVHVAVFPAASFTVHNTLVVPTGYDPDAFAVPLNELTTEATEQLSPVTGMGTVTFTAHCPAGTGMVTEEAQLMVGF